jgi:hypothetical protein
MTIRQEILNQLREQAAAGTWTAQASQIPGVPTFRWTREEITPDWALEGANPDWTGDKYDRHVFLTLISQRGPWIMRVCPCPWVRCQDTQPPLWLVDAIVKDPELAFDIARQLQMRQARRGGRFGDGVRR